MKAARFPEQLQRAAPAMGTVVAGWCWKMRVAVLGTLQVDAFGARMKQISLPASITQAFMRPLCQRARKVLPVISLQV
jgi:hypothetical protein